MLEELGTKMPTVGLYLVICLVIHYLQTVDIETFLFGINSTNLLNLKNVKPNLKTIPNVSFFDRIPMIMPKPLVVENKQRPFPLP